ncbi:MAG TPA: hypothetical protein DEP45_07115 [Armatimonadetes bacterium]|nr:hypothetical protein [Armatimonadota bacterium]
MLRSGETCALLVALLTVMVACQAQEPEQSPSWVERDGVTYGAQADGQGPIGGGEGYANTVTEGDFTVETLEALIEALAQAQPGQTVFIPGETEIDLTTFIYIDEFVLEIPEGVTLAGERGNGGSLGAILTSDALKTPVMIRVLGPDVRITGLRIRGPNPKRYLEHHRRAFGQGGPGSSYYYKFPTQNGITTEFDRLEVDNCDVSGFGHGGVSLGAGADHHIHHNYIHHCQYNGLGYGIVHSTAFSLIECNLFDWNRHSIAGSGRTPSGYIARNNIELGASLSHCFDMHGGRDRGDGTDIAGTRIEIYNNTFRAPQRAIAIRGVPEDICDVHHNWFVTHATPDAAVRAADRTTIHDNVYGPDAGPPAEE